VSSRRNGPWLRRTDMSERGVDTRLHIGERSPER
jgi:hypothetical protein